MGRKATAVKIHKDRLDLILKSRKITITKMAEDMGYNRKSLSRAINREEMAAKTLEDICAYLNVAPPFLTGVFQLKESAADPCGYFVPEFNYSAYVGSKLKPMMEQNQPYYDLLVQEGERGIPADGKRIHYDETFVYDNAYYLIPPIRRTLIDKTMSAINQDPDYLAWRTGTDPEEEQDE